MLSSESWDVLQERCLAIVSEKETDRALLEVLSSAAARASAPSLSGRWKKLLTAICNATRLKWNSSGRLLSAGDLAAFQSARQAANCDCPIPDTGRTWDSLKDAFHDSVSDYSPGDSFDFEPFDDLTEFATELDRADPDLLAQRGFPEDFENEIVAVVDAAHEAMNDPNFSDDPEELRKYQQRLSDCRHYLPSCASTPMVSRKSSGGGPPHLRSAPPNANRRSQKIPVQTMSTHRRRMNCSM